jgi:peptidoglycan/LPS O-acetylase OafA/YrhL
MAGTRAGGSQQKREIPSLTGLRGVAALCVVFSHFWFWTSVTPVNQLPTTAWVDTSTIGMAIFFTLSGYVIALSYSHWIGAVDRSTA